MLLGEAGVVLIVRGRVRGWLRMACLRMVGYCCCFLPLVVFLWLVVAVVVFPWLVVVVFPCLVVAVASLGWLLLLPSFGCCSAGIGWERLQQGSARCGCSTS